MPKRLLRVVLCLCSLAVAGWGKDKPLTAIILYDSDSGPAYVHVTDVLLNGKSEVLACPSEKTVDNNGYRRLSKVLLSQAVSLERGSDGILYMATTSGSNCVVPSNLKLDRNSRYSAKDLADRAVISGTFVARSNNGMQGVPSEFKIGTVLHFVSAPDTELAEYLRAGRAKSIALWRTYVAQYPSSSHAAEARQNLAALIVAAAAADVAEYQKSASAETPDLARLRNARLQADDAHQLAPALTSAQKLQFEIRTQIEKIVTSAQEEMTAFQQSLGDRKPGYEHLLKAQSRIGDALTVDAGFQSAVKLQAEINGLAQTMQQTVARAQSQVSAKQFDEAYNTISRYRQYSGEVPEIAKVVDAAFKNRRDRGQENLQAGRWAEAIANFQRALTYKDDPSTAAALKQAAGELQSVQNKEGADRAIEGSKLLAADKRYIEAYETLAQLPPEQRSLVGDQMAELQPKYQDDLVRRSETLSRVHVPIRGRADEDAVRLAHDYLSRASRLAADDEAIKVKLDLLSDRLSDYYLKQAARLLSKPRGSGAGLGWLMLQEAQSYKPDLQTIKDNFTKYAPVYETHAKLSIGIRMRDQTSRREGVGFADQMTDTIAAGLEAARIPGLKIVTLTQTPPTNPDNQGDTAGTQPNFLLQGDILQHRVEKKMDTERMTSHYRSGQSEIHNPAWLEAKRQYDAAQDDINKAQEEQRTPGRRKKSAAEAADEMRALTDRQAELKKKLDSIPEYVLKDVILPYNYTKRTEELTGIVELSFRLSEPSGEAREATHVSMNLPKTFVLLENVKPEDVDGILENDTPPDEIELLSEAERQTRSAMMSKLVEKLNDLPKTILEKARSQAASKDTEAAAESYILYLNSTPDKSTPERTEAQDYLQKEFNVGPPKSSSQ